MVKLKTVVPIPVCANCRFYRPPKSGPGASYRVPGQCRRYPEQVAKDSDDWCGEHE